MTVFNRYPVQYWARLFPFPAGSKQRILELLRSLAWVAWSFPCPRGIWRRSPGSSTPRDKTILPDPDLAQRRFEPSAEHQAVGSCKLLLRLAPIVRPMSRGRERSLLPDAPTSPSPPRGEDLPQQGPLFTSSGVACATGPHGRRSAGPDTGGFAPRTGPPAAPPAAGPPSAPPAAAPATPAAAPPAAALATRPACSSGVSSGKCSLMYWRLKSSIVNDMAKPSPRSLSNSCPSSRLVCSERRR